MADGLSDYQGVLKATFETAEKVLPIPTVKSIVKPTSKPLPFGFIQVGKTDAYNTTNIAKPLSDSEASSLKDFIKKQSQN